MKSKFSVLMSVYKNDSPSHLGEALQSIADQTLQADEIVVVIDGPVSDEVLQVVNSFASSMPITVEQLPVNGGLGWALRRGVELCSHEWIYRMDADDICINTRFEKQAQYIEGHPEVDVVGGWIEEFDKCIGDLSRFRQVPTDSSDIHQEMLTYASINHVTVAVRKSAVIATGSYRGGRNFQEDYELWLRMLNKGYRFSNLGEVLVHVRVGGGMIGRRGGLEYLKNECKVHYMSYKFGLIPFHKFVSNMLIRVVTRLAPERLREAIYGIARGVINSGSKAGS